MKSKEALENWYNTQSPRTKAYEYELHYRLIKKDLEVLEILKKHFQYTETGQWYIDMQESDSDFRSECSKQEWDNSPQKKIKEWLNDK